jgi:hypothetical protein
VRVSRDRRDGTCNKGEVKMQHGSNSGPKACGTAQPRSTAQSPRITGSNRLMDFPLGLRGRKVAATPRRPRSYAMRRRLECQWHLMAHRTLAEVWARRSAWRKHAPHTSAKSRRSKRQSNRREDNLLPFRPRVASKLRSVSAMSLRVSPAGEPLVPATAGI